MNNNFLIFFVDGGVLGGVGPRSHSKSVSSNSSDDIFNESNYHCDTIDE